MWEEGRQYICKHRYSENGSDLQTPCRPPWVWSPNQSTVLLLGLWAILSSPILGPGTPILIKKKKKSNHIKGRNYTGCQSPLPLPFCSGTCVAFAAFGLALFSWFFSFLIKLLCRERIKMITEVLLLTSTFLSFSLLACRGEYSPHSLCVEEHLFEYTVACLEGSVHTLNLTNSLQAKDSFCFWILNFPGYSFARVPFWSMDNRFL